MNFQQFLQHSKLDSKPYQSFGVDWCIERERSTSKYCRGGIIADEMGLGKTIMMIGLIVCNFKMPNLIILPVVLIEQWKEQFENTTGHTPIIYHGATKKRISLETLQKSPVVITTYGTILSDAKTQAKKLQSVRWTRIICDEAHHLRNKNTHITRAVLQLDSKIKWLITGTPIQNHINDLYSLFDVLSIPKKVYINTDHIKDVVKSVLLKRTKSEVGIQIPPIYVHRVATSWENMKEQKLSEEIHDNLQFSRRLNKSQPVVVDRNEQLRPTTTNNGMLLAMMMYARKMCVYPRLACENIKKVASLGLVSGDNLDGVNYASKMNGVVNKIIERKHNGNNKIIFTNFKGEIDHLKTRLQSYGLVVDSIDGRITKRKRQFILHQELDVLILQIKTGNEGLNLQKYNEVYFVTPEWNPKMEDQAIARCHRIGQTKPVFVFRFVMRSCDVADQTQNIEMYSETVQEQKREIEQESLNRD